MTARKPLTRREFGLILTRQNCRCASCGGKLDFTKPRLVVDEHLVPIFSTPEGKDPNRLENRALYCIGCATAKTSKEAPARAKVRRFEQGKTQADKRKARGSSIHGRKISPLSKNSPGYRKTKIQSRGFGK